MNEIIFRRTSNVFLNSGIVALHWYLEYRKGELMYEYENVLGTDTLIIRCDDLLKLLEEVYYVMGKEVYDTPSTKKAVSKEENAYYVSDQDVFVRFPRLKTYGLGALITNDPAGKTRRSENTLRRSQLQKIKPTGSPKGKALADLKSTILEKGLIMDGEGGDVLVAKYEAFYAQSGLTLGQQLYVNEPYSKTTRLEIEEKHLKAGKHICSVTGEGYQKLVDTTSISPFLSGILNFDSFQSTQSRKVSWKAMYISRFAPKICLYQYAGGLDSLMGYFFVSNDLRNTFNLFKGNRSFYKDQAQLLETNYRSNINLRGFGSVKKETTGTRDFTRDYTEASELLFVLVWEFYTQFLFEHNLQSDAEIDLLFGELERTPISLLYFRADKFASTMRPNAYEEFNNFKFAVSLIHFMRSNDVAFSELFGSLKIIKPSERESKNSYRIERQTRARVLDGMLHGRSIVAVIASLMYGCYTQLVASTPAQVGYKRFFQLKLLVELYEPIIQYGGNMNMNKELQERAINLGTSIGQGILRFAEPGEKPDTKKNARDGRRYVIGLYKARTVAQFNDAIIRIMNRYGVVVSKELIANVSSANFEYLKQFAIISALNQINSALKSKQNDESK
ncbi:MAG: hypothetical protein WBA12_07725 [Catalinimonas sp.]